jgi:hypothetical protein
VQKQACWRHLKHCDRSVERAEGPKRATEMFAVQRITSERCEITDSGAQLFAAQSGTGPGNSSIGAAINDCVIEANQFEPIVDTGQGLGMTNAKETSRIETIEQVGRRNLSRRIVEINQQVAAKDNVERPLGRHACGIDEVHVAEQHRFFQVVDDFPMLVLHAIEIPFARPARAFASASVSISDPTISMRQASTIGQFSRSHMAME